MLATRLQRPSRQGQTGAPADGGARCQLQDPLNLPGQRGQRAGCAQCKKWHALVKLRDRFTRALIQAQANRAGSRATSNDFK